MGADDGLGMVLGFFKGRMGLGWVVVEGKDISDCVGRIDVSINKSKFHF